MGDMWNKNKNYKLLSNNNVTPIGADAAVVLCGNGQILICELIKMAILTLLVNWKSVSVSMLLLLLLLHEYFVLKIYCSQLNFYCLLSFNNNYNNSNEMFATTRRLKHLFIRDSVFAWEYLFCYCCFVYTYVCVCIPLVSKCEQMYLCGGLCVLNI